MACCPGPDWDGSGLDLDGFFGGWLAFTIARGICRSGRVAKQRLRPSERVGCRAWLRRSQRGQHIPSSLRDEDRGYRYRFGCEPPDYRMASRQPVAEPNDGPGATFAFTILSGAGGLPGRRTLKLACFGCMRRFSISRRSADSARWQSAAIFGSYVHRVTDLASVLKLHVDPRSLPTAASLAWSPVSMQACTTANFRSPCG
jgi:hypothetical protein